MTWKKIKQNENYSINESGEVRNDLTGHIRKPVLNKSNGYLQIDLWKGNQREKYCIHRLLAESFIPNPQSKPCIDHADGSRQNNSLENLRWATYGENNSRFNTNGVRSERIKVTRYAEERKKRGGGHVKWLDAVETVEFDRITDAANFFSVTIGNISAMLKKGTIGMRGKMRGFLFEYAER